jgi:hypothetical protein
LATKDRGFS